MSIVAREIPCAEGRIGVLTLSSPPFSGHLSLKGIDDSLAALRQWKDDAGLALVVLHGDENTFCTGVDLRALHETLLPGRNALPPYIESTFIQLALLFHQLHTYPKPVLAWASGVADGAGLGLLSACRYRLGTPSLCLSQTEVLSGYCPAAGATWYLNRLPGNIGLFLALTGVGIRAGDAYRLGLLDNLVDGNSLEPLLESLRQTRWDTTMAANDNRLHRLLKQFPRESATAENSPMANHETAIIEDCRAPGVNDVISALQARSDDDPWYAEVQRNLRRASPVSSRLIHEQLQRGESLSLAAGLRMEVDLTVNCLQREEAVNGIWSRLNPDRGSPSWSYPNPEEVPDEWIASHFESPWRNTHPLGHL